MLAKNIRISFDKLTDIDEKAIEDFCDRHRYRFYLVHGSNYDGVRLYIRKHIWEDIEVMELGDLVRSIRARRE